MLQAQNRDSRYGASVGRRPPPQQKRAPDHALLQLRMIDEAQQRYTANVLADKVIDQRATFETKSEAYEARRLAAGQLKHLQTRQRAALQERRARLRATLDAEEEEAIAAALSSQLTPLERQALMRERAKQIVAEKESARSINVADRQQQQFVENCDELRLLKGRKITEATAVHRGDQLAEKASIRAREAEVNGMFDQLWEQDRLRKEAREQADAAALAARTQEQIAVLSEQMAALQFAREDAVHQKAAEQALRLEQAELLRQEEARAVEDAQRKKERTALVLQRHNQRIIQARRLQMENDQARDMKLIESVLHSKDEVEAQGAAKKTQRRHDMQAYLDALKQQRLEQAALDTQAGTRMQSEIDKAAQKQYDRWEQEAEARRVLMADVMAVRQTQVQSKLDALAGERFAWQREGEDVAQAAHCHAQQQQEEQRQRLEGAKVHRGALIDQTQDNERRRLERREQERREQQLLKDAEAQMQAKIAAELHKMDAPGVSGRGGSRRGTAALVTGSPLSPFALHNDGALGTPPAAGSAGGSRARGGSSARPVGGQLSSVFS